MLMKNIKLKIKLKRLKKKLFKKKQQLKELERDYKNFKSEMEKNPDGKN